MAATAFQLRTAFLIQFFFIKNICGACAEAKVAIGIDSMTQHHSMCPEQKIRRKQKLFKYRKVLRGLLAGTCIGKSEKSSALEFQ